jgi:hypothetical protein
MVGTDQQSQNLSGGNGELDGQVVEVIPRLFAQKVSKDHADYWEADDGSWLCTSNDVNHAPQRFTTNITTASQYPQCRPSHNPIVVKRQAMQTEISNTIAQEPIRLNPARA